MTVLLDTNVIMDALQERSPFDVPAKEILLRGQNGELTCLLTANAAADIFYLYSKARDIQSAKAALDFLLSIITRDEILLETDSSVKLIAPAAFIALLQ